MLTSFFKKLSPASLVLTANSRLAEDLQSSYNVHQQSEGENTWEAATILPWSRWLEQQFHHHNKEGLFLLNDFQEHCIWENIVQDSSNTIPLMQPTAMARLVKQAYATLALWQTPVDTLTPFSAHCETQCLIDWIQLFKKQCSKNQWITQADLSEKIVQLDDQHSFKLPEKIILTGFDDINPAMQTLLEQWQKRTVIETEMISDRK